MTIAGWLRCLTLLTILAASATDSGAAEPFTLRLLSYNIHHGEGTDGKLDLERIAEVINAVKPDLVALQEVDRGAERSNRIDEPAELARLTGMTAVFERNIPLQGGDYGNAVLSRLPITGHRNVPLPSLYEGEQRGVLVVDLTAPDGETPLRLFATHLDHRPNDEERMASVELIASLVAEEPDRPSILMGDLNARPDSRILEAFDRTWRRANPEPVPTFPAAEPTRQIDYILSRPSDAWRTVEVRVPKAPVASDHAPIFAVLESLGGPDGP